ncbi:hypothetical protein SLEP1_g53150 [Rubroshorea leprosula]|uniref:HAT C-terminal dimerisation domain-containing protein n=1 Tax=Rubroshorea leprosula TaxID=152421 RepID=A0AAV5MBB1_9ROSI|nr:hypothetical protein SLEP1_g53150 [Rubroshorea leprosula]
MGLLLSLDIPTRWNSLYLMLEVAEKYELAFDRVDVEVEEKKQYGLDLSNGINGTAQEEDDDAAAADGSYVFVSGKDAVEGGDPVEADHEANGNGTRELEIVNGDQIDGSGGGDLTVPIKDRNGEPFVSQSDDHRHPDNGIMTQNGESSIPEDVVAQNIVVKGSHEPEFEVLGVGDRDLQGQVKSNLGLGLEENNESQIGVEQQAPVAQQQQQAPVAVAAAVAGSGGDSSSNRWVWWWQSAAAAAEQMALAEQQQQQQMGPVVATADGPAATAATAATTGKLKVKFNWMGIPAGPHGAGKISRGENDPRPRPAGRNIPPRPIPVAGIPAGPRRERGELPSLIEEDNPKLNILAWWKLNSPRFPVLSAMAKDVLAVPISIVASESCFSTNGRVPNAFRSSLTPRIVQALICAQDWLKPKGNLVFDEEDLDNLLNIEQCVEKLGLEATFLRC